MYVPVTGVVFVEENICFTGELMSLCIVFGYGGLCELSFLELYSCFSHRCLTTNFSTSKVSR